MNKIFDDKIMSELKRASSTDARCVSLKIMLLKVAYRSAELETKLQAELDEIKARLGILKNEKKS